MEIEPSSSPLAFFAFELKRMRTLTGITQEALAEAAAYAPATVAAIETCRRLPSADFAERTDKELGADGLLIRLQALVEETSVLPWFRDLVTVERKATEIREYDAYVIPGLLQTENYARCCVAATRPALTTHEIERAVALRMTRQEILDRDDPPSLWVIVEQAALRRLVGGTEIMNEQFEHLHRMCERPNIVVQVIPESEGPTAAGGRSFTLLTFRNEPTVGYLEDIRNARYIRKADEVSWYSLTFDHLRSSALTDNKSATLLPGGERA